MSPIHIAINERFTESGTTHANITFLGRSQNMVNTRLQLDTLRTFDNSEIYFRGGVQARKSHSDSIQARIGNNTIQLSSQASTDATGGFVGTGFSWKMDTQHTLLADFETGRMTGDETYIAGQISFQYRF